MKTRNGSVYLQLKKCNGDLSAIEDFSESSAHMTERNSGNYGDGTKELQLKNYQRAKELEKERAREAKAKMAAKYAVQAQHRLHTKILHSLQTFEHAVEVEPAVAARARRSVERMLEIGRGSGG